MELQGIYEELVGIGRLDSIDFDEFMSLLYDYPRVLDLRKDLINYGFEVVDPQLFLTKVVDEIPDLRSTSLRKWGCFEMQSENFLIVTEFTNSLDSYQQKIFLFNESEELEFLTDIKSPLSFYSKNSSYLDSLPVSFDNAFIAALEKGITQPTLFQVFKKHISELLANGEHKKATIFLTNRKKYLDSESTQKLESRIKNNFNEANVYGETKADILQALKDDNFIVARNILKKQFNNLNSNSYEDLEDLIRNHEDSYQQVIELGDEGEVKAQQDILDEYEHRDEMRDLEEENLKSQINSREENIRLKQEDLRHTYSHNKKMEEIEMKKLNSRNEVIYYTCLYCQKTVPGLPPPPGCKQSNNGLHRWNKHR